MKQNTKGLGYAILIFLIAYTILIGIYADQIANFSLTQNSVLQLIIYYLTQSQFVIILIGAVYIGLILKSRLFESVSAGILLDIATDMSSTPHCVLSTGFVQNAPNLILCSDTIIIQWMDKIFPHMLSYALYYWIVPVLLIITAFEVLGVTRFVRYFIKK